MRLRVLSRCFHGFADLEVRGGVLRVIRQWGDFLLLLCTSVPLVATQP